MALADRAESVSVEYALALDWSEALDGTPVCYDDGAVYDELVSTLTMRLTPSELSVWEAAFQGDREMTFLDWTGLPLGPEIDVSSGTVTAIILDLIVDGPADSSMTLFDVTAVLQYGPLSAPSAGSITAVLDNGVPYHSLRPSTKALRTDGGTVELVEYGAESTRRTVWYASGLSRSEVVDAINWLRTFRGGNYLWAASGLSRPFGPGESQNATVRFPAWKVNQESNFTWGIELEVVRNV